MEKIWKKYKKYKKYKEYKGTEEYKEAKKEQHLRKLEKIYYRKDEEAEEPELMGLTRTKSYYKGQKK